MRTFHRFLGIGTTVLCCLGAVLLLLYTPYGKTVTGNYYFSRFLSSQAQEDGEKAFRFWQQSANKEAFLQAFDRIPQDSPLWKDYIRRSSKLYSHREHPEQLLNYLDTLARKLVHPLSQSAVHFEIGTACQGQDEQRAKEHFRMVIALGADQEYMDRSRGNIHEIENLGIGKQVPDFSLTTITGRRIESTDLRGKVVLLEFWSMHCPSCVDKIPLLQKINAEAPANDFSMIAISLDHGKKELSFIEKNNLHWHHVMVDRSRAPALLDNFNIQYIPSSYVLDREGRIAFKKLPGKDLEEAILTLLKTPAVGLDGR